MIKLLLKLSVVIFIAFVIGGCDKVDSNLTIYQVKVANDSLYEITDVFLQMVGSPNTVSIDTIAVGSRTEYYELLLQKSKGAVPLVYGDYQGEYIQNGTKKDIYILDPATVITIRISNESFSVE